MASTKITNAGPFHAQPLVTQALIRPLKRVESNRTAVTWLFALAILVASTYRIPFLDQLEVVKIGIFCAELLSGFLLMLLVRRRSEALALVCLLAMLVCMRVLLGHVTADLVFEQALIASLQEARFGIMIAAAPLSYVFLRDASNTQLRSFVVAYLAILLWVDTALFATLSNDDSVILGFRTDTRFLCSILTPLLATAVLVARRHLSGEPYIGFALLASGLMLSHAFLISTSRIESLLTVGFLGFALCLRWPRARGFLYIIAVAGIASALPQMVSPGEYIAGRQFKVAFDLAHRFLPLGLGAVVDTSAKSELGLPDDFYFSDYGLLLYVLRYGVLGLMLVLALLLLWLKFSLTVAKTKGSIFLFGSMLIYLTFIPLLDYGSLNGGFFLAFMLLASQKQFYRLR